jgi:YD repeat-containing protein
MKQISVLVDHDRCRDGCSSLTRATCVLALVFLLVASPLSLNWDASDNFLSIKSAQAGQASSPDLTVSSLGNPPSTAIVGASFSVTDTIRNAGNATAGASTTRYRLSTDGTISSADPLLTGSRSILSLNKGASSSGTVTVTVPSTITPGAYYLAACADDLGVVAESSETNNCRASTTTVTLFAAPIINSLSSTAGSIGTSITINGSNFGAVQSDSTITFNGIQASPTGWNDTTIVASVPSLASTGPVVVTVGGVVSNGVQFNVSGIAYIYDQLGRLRAVVDPASDTAVYNYDAVGNLLSISRRNSSGVSVIEFSPKTGLPGTQVTIFGTGFSSAPGANTVTFNGLSAAVSSATTTSIVATVPAGATTGPIGVSNPTGSAASMDVFTVADPGTPTITSFTPIVGAPGMPVGISGTNFDGNPSRDRLTFNNMTSWATSATTTNLTVPVPTGGTSGKITVTTPAGSSKSTSDFFVPPSPLIEADVGHTGRATIGGGGHTVSIGTAGKLGLVVFDGTANQQITINVSNVTFSTRLSVVIYNPNGTILKSQAINTTGGTVSAALAQNGTHTIVLGTGVISTVAGNGTFGYSGDGGPATSASIWPQGLAVDSFGNIFISQEFGGGGHVVRKVGTNGIIAKFAGSLAGFSGDGGSATKARLWHPSELATDPAGNVFIHDSANYRIRKVNTSNIITTVAGNGVDGCTGEGIPATQAQISQPIGLAADAQGNLFLAISQGNFTLTGCVRVRRVDAAGIITTVAGTGTTGFSGDGGPATSARLNDPYDVTFDGQGNLYIADKGNNRIRKVDTNGIITTIAGIGISGFSGDWGPAINAQFSSVQSLVHYNGELYVADSSRVRKIDSAGTVTTVFGTGTNSFNGDGLPAKLADGSAPDVALDGAGNLYIYNNARIRKIEPSSIGSATLTLSTP